MRNKLSGTLTIYLCGPISLGGIATPKQIKVYLARFHSEAARLRKLGLKVLSPAEISEIHGGQWEDYMRLTITMLCKCHQVCVLPDHEKSIGAAIEIQLAHTLKIAVVRSECVQ